MIAVDTNILLYAHRPELPNHAVALERLTALVEGTEQWAIPVFCLAEFVHVATHPRFLDNPYSIGEASEALGRVMASPSVHVLLPGPRFVPLFLDAMVEANAIGNRIFDAQIVGLYREAGLSSLLTEDRDFARFKGVRIQRL